MPERLQRLHLRRDRPGVRADRGRHRRDRPVPRCWRTPASASRWRRPTRSGRCWRPGITAWLCLQAFINIGVVVALLPITGITLPFVSAGGSSLIISFAAVGILLSISRETVEKGTWNDDATADRGRRDGRTHLPGARRRPVTRAAVRTRLSCAGSAATAASRRPSSRPPGIPLRRLARALAADDRGAIVHAVLDPIRLGVSVPAGDRDPRRGAAGRDLHDRRLRGDPGPDGRRAAAASRSSCGTATSIPGRAVRATARLAAALAVSFEATCAGAPRRGARACRAIVTGTPIRDIRDVDRAAARRRLDMPAGRARAPDLRRLAGGPPLQRRGGRGACRGSSSGSRSST